MTYTRSPWFTFLMTFPQPIEPVEDYVVFSDGAALEPPSDLDDEDE